MEWFGLDDAGSLNFKVWSLHLIQNISNMFTDFSLILAYPTLYLSEMLVNLQRVHLHPTTFTYFFI